MSNRKKAVLALVLVSAIWGIASVVIKYTLNYIEPVLFLYIRFIIASIILFFLVDFKKVPKELSFWKTGNIKEINKKDIKIFLLGALGSSINLTLIFYAFKYTTAIEGTLIYAAAPIFTALGGWILLNENLTKKEISGLIISFLGFIFIAIRPLIVKDFQFSFNFLGNFLMVLAVFTWVSYILLSKDVFNKNNKNKNYSPIFITFVTFFAGAVSIAPLGTYELFNTDYNLRLALPGILYMAIISSVIAYALFDYGVKLIEASEAELFHYLQPVFAVPAAIIFLNESLHLIEIGGSIIIITGLYIAEKYGRAN